ncbi:MAG TPA: glycosyltransferase, partial [Candidatus Bathyarchaeota archaeon]|nr:glycosyltransferase [Candidatus Bathyarchaeota archaeon]
MSVEISMRVKKKNNLYALPKNYPVRGIAVLLPCLNEEKTIKQVIKDFKNALPQAHIYVYDNGSTDNSLTLAAEAGAITKTIPKRGKGNAVRAMFKDIDADVYLMADADLTYSAKDAFKLIKEVLNGYDMVVGKRSFKAVPRLHVFGNKMITGLINKLFNANISDVFSGYRAFSRNFVKSYPTVATGFEIETEMTLFALDRNFSIKEVEVNYKERIEGSFSKLNTFTDGL